MKTQKLLVIVASVFLMAFFNVLSFAQTTNVQSPSDAPTVLANALRGQGLEVFTDDNFVEFYVGQDLVGLDFSPQNEITFKVNGKVVDQNRRIYADRRIYAEGDLTAEAPITTLSLIDQNTCIQLALEIYNLQLEFCGLNPACTIVCIPRATYGFALNVLQCVAP
jgi:hypothetical protein